MKKIFTILGIAFCLNLNAQSNRFLPKESTQSNHGLPQKHIGLHKFKANNASKASIGNSTQAQTFIAIYDSIYSWSWDTLNLTWNISGRYDNFVYDAHLNMTSYLYQSWTGGAWLNSSQNSYTYNANNNQASYLVQTWSGTAWANQYQEIYTYNANNLITSTLEQTWNGSAWVNYYLQSYTYDTNNNQITDVWQTWSGSVWVNYFQDNYTYDTYNNQINDLQQTWSGSAWVNKYQKNYIYDVNNNQTNYIFQTWSGSNWVNDFQDFYTYDVNNNKISLAEKNWDGTAWTIMSEQGNYTYDANNNESSQAYKFYNTAGTKVTGGDSLHYYLNGTCVSLVPHICLVSTDSATNYNYNIVYWNNVGYSHIDSFIVYRYDAVSANYLRIGAVSKNALSEFIDTAFSIGGPNGGNPQYAGWKYKLAIRDTCWYISAKSPYHQSTFVQNSGSAFSWTPYVDSGQVNLPTGYSFLRDDNNTGVWHVLANVSTNSCTDPNYASFPNANWRVDALGFNCNPSYKLSGNNSVDAARVKSHSNQNNNRGATTGLKQISSNNLVTIYPNPNNGTFNIELSNVTKQTMQVYDVNGKLVLSQTINGKTTIDGSNLSEGVYNVNLISNVGVVNKKLVIVR